MQIINRSDAKALGLKRYFTGKKCRFGHTCERYVNGHHCVDCNLKNVLDWVKNNRDATNERTRKSYTIEKWKASPSRTKLYFSAKQSTRRARIRGIEGKHNQKDIIIIFDKQNGKCANCLTKLLKNYHVDHIVPISKGGSNFPSNIQCLCKTCNLMKGSKDPIDWAIQNGRLL